MFNAFVKNFYCREENVKFTIVWFDSIDVIDLEASLVRWAPGVVLYECTDATF